MAAVDVGGAAATAPVRGDFKLRRLGARLTASRSRRVLLVIIGLCLWQSLLYGPSLVGRRILLPLELLAEGGVYLPTGTAAAKSGRHDASRFDVVLQFEPERQFAARELAAGRWPRWLPYEYCGVPMRFSVLAPLFLFKASTTSPVVLAWAQLLVALIAGLGMYAFCRSALRVGFWAAAFAAWCYPLTGQFIFWQGFPVADTLCWFPWLIVAMQALLQRWSVWRIAAVSVVTALMLIHGQLDVAGLGLLAGAGAVLLVAGWTIWCERSWRVPCAGALRIGAGLVLGLMLAAPGVLPYLEYAHDGGRIAQRAEGQREERPPVGPAAIPLMLWPDRDGRMGAGTLFFHEGNQMESAAVGYAGAAMTLFFVPLAWRSRRHRAANVLCVVAIVLGLGWCANLPGWVTLLRLPGLNLFSFNRFVFVTGFALMAQAAIGLDELWARPLEHRGWFAIAMALCAGFIGLAAVRMFVLPEPLATRFGAALHSGTSVNWIRTADDLQQVQRWYRGSATGAVLWGGLALAGWIALLLAPGRRRIVGIVVAIAAISELLHFSHGRWSQADPALYYPRNPTLSAAFASGTGRVIGFFCLPANVAATQGLSDVRGYDPVEPARLAELLRLGADPQSPVSNYTSTQWLAPAVLIERSGQSRVAPVLDLLGVRYIVSRGQPMPQARVAFAGDDYWGVVNDYAVPRVFVPQHVEFVPDSSARLQKMASGAFNPHIHAYVEAALRLPVHCVGSARITRETPTQLVITATMDTPGLVVVADRWDVGWRAAVNGRPAPILRVDHALRGVVVPAGTSTIQYTYAPSSFRVGGMLAGAAALFLVAGLVVSISRRRRPVAA